MYHVRLLLISVTLDDVTGLSISSFALMLLTNKKKSLPMILALLDTPFFDTTFHTFLSFRAMISFSLAALKFSLFLRGSSRFKASVLSTPVYAMSNSATSNVSLILYRSRSACCLLASKFMSSSGDSWFCSLIGSSASSAAVSLPTAMHELFAGATVGAKSLTVGLSPSV